MNVNAIQTKVAPEQGLSAAALAVQQAGSAAATFNEFLKQAGASLTVNTSGLVGSKQEAEPARRPETSPRTAARPEQRSEPSSNDRVERDAEETAVQSAAPEKAARPEAKPQPEDARPEPDRKQRADTVKADVQRPATTTAATDTAPAPAGESDMPVADPALVMAVEPAPAAAAPLVEAEAAVGAAEAAAAAAAPKARPAADADPAPSATKPVKAEQRPQQASAGTPEGTDVVDPMGDAATKPAASASETSRPQHAGNHASAANPAAAPAASETVAQQAAGLAKQAGSDARMHVKVRVSAPATEAATETPSVTGSTTAAAPELVQPERTAQPATHGQPQNARVAGLPDPAAAQALQAQAGHAMAGAVETPGGNGKGVGLTSAAQAVTATGGGATASEAGAGAAHATNETQQAARAAAVTPPRHSAAFRHAVVDQVSVKISKAAADGLDHIKIQLRPASLGRIEVEIEMSQDGRLAAVVTADNKDTLELLQRDAKTLEKALQDAGFQADSGSLTFNLRSGDSGRSRGEAGTELSGRPGTEEEQSLDDLLSADTFTPRADKRIDIRA